MKVIVFAEKEAAPFSVGADGDTLVISNEEVSSIKPSICEQLECFDVLESHEDPEILTTLLTKVRIGGTIKIKGTDSLQACRMRERGILSNADFSNIVVFHKQRCHDIQHILKKIKETKAFEIRFAGVSGTEYFLEARRSS
tara:strand:- start:24113 stop:24535 length:423 start_codon:yes stop_codon:yes gene_type:complete